MWTAGRLVTVFVLGGLGGILGDQIHVRLGVLWYPSTNLFLGQPWWVGPQFGLGLVAILSAAGAFARRGRPPVREYVTGAAWFVSAYLASGLFDHSPRALLAVYLLTFAARMAIRADRGQATLFCLIVGVGGFAWEAFISSQGLFHYYRPDVFHVGMWLPGIYLHGAPLALTIRRGLAPQAAEASASTVDASSRTSG